jgi:hypothetical protein
MTNHYSSVRCQSVGRLLGRSCRLSASPHGRRRLEIGEGVTNTMFANKGLAAEIRQRFWFYDCIG